MKRLYFIIQAVIALCLVSCKEQNLESIYSSQEERIDSFIKNLIEKNQTPPAPENPDGESGQEGQQQPEITVVNNSGSNRVTLVPGDGIELQEGGTVSFYYAGYVFNGSISGNNLFATNHEETATAEKWDVTSPDFSLMTVKLGKDDNLVKGLHNGLLGVKAGEECYILFSGKYGFGNKNIGMIPVNSAIAYKIWVENVTE